MVRRTEKSLAVRSLLLLTVGKADRREGVGAVLERWPIARPHEAQPDVGRSWASP